MKRGFRLSVLAVALAIASPLACGVTSGNSGSNTNWLSICTDDADCADGYSCLCGVCTSACELDGEGCSQDAAQCTALHDVGCAPRNEHDDACLPSCSEDADCESWGDGLACETGVCVAATVVGEPPDPLDALNLPDLEPLSGPAKLALGLGFGCVTRAGRVWCWGANSVGQAAQLPIEETLPIAEITSGMGKVTDLVAGPQHACSLNEEGEVYCWGLNDRGQVGPQSGPEMTCLRHVLDEGPLDLPCQPTPSFVANLPRVAGLALNHETTCAWFEDGQFTCWGNTSLLDTLTTELTGGVTEIALGSMALCAVASATGEFWCSEDEAVALSPDGHGLDLSQELGSVPSFGCMLGVNGRVDCWGRDEAGQRGLASFGSPVPTADDAPAIAAGALEVHVGRDHACALLDDGAVMCWGRNDQSQVGAGPNVSSRCGGIPCQPTPTRVAGIPRAVDLAVSELVSCALSEDAELYCWGNSDPGSPWRIPGPWEGGAGSCDGIDHAIAQEILKVREVTPVFAACETDNDCVEVDLGVSCHAGCQSRPLHRDQADALTAELAAIDDEYCPVAEQQDCDFADPACPPRQGELACVNGVCTRFDAEVTACDDACACSVLEYVGGEPPMVIQSCEGHYLGLMAFVPCATCSGSRLYFAIGNYGQSAFAGEVTVELVPGETEMTLPPPLTVTLSLEPGAHSEPLYFEVTEGPGAALARLVVEDNCDYNSEWADVPVELPAVPLCPK